MQTTQVYVLERVYEDLRPQFVARDMLHQLAQLDVVVDDIFNRMLCKCSQEKDRMAAIDNRIRLCQAKVNAIAERSTTRKPTTVFSMSKYPAPKVLPRPKPLFHDKPYAQAPMSRDDAKDDTHFLPANPMPPAQRILLSNETLDQISRPREVDMTSEGLGCLPECVQAVGNMLLFNSGENLYQKYRAWDNLLGSDYEDVEETKYELAKAPKTLVDGDELPLVQRPTDCFRPSMSTMEHLSGQLPTNLPLENIANYVYTDEAGAHKSIAPSIFLNKKAALPDLPSVGVFTDGPSVSEASNRSAQVEKRNELPRPPPPPPSHPHQLRLTTRTMTKRVKRQKSGIALRTQTSNRPLAIGEYLKQHMQRRELVISEKQDKLEQRREMELIAEPVKVLTAVEITAPPPPPLLENSIDNGGDEEKDVVKCSREGSRYVLRRVKRDENGQNEGAPVRSRPSMEEATNSLTFFKTRMVGLRLRATSLSMSENSDWSDD